MDEEQHSWRAGEPSRAGERGRKAGQKKDANESAKKAREAYGHANELRKEWADRVAYLGRKARRRKEFARAGKLLAAAAKGYDEAEADAYDEEGDSDAADRESALADEATRK